MEAANLIAEAKQLLAKAEETVKNFEHAEATQLRIVVNRLRLFIEQHVTHDAPAPKAEEPVSEPEAPADDAPTEEPSEPKRRARAKTEE